METSRTNNSVTSFQAVEIVDKRVRFIHEFQAIIYYELYEKNDRKQKYVEQRPIRLFFVCFINYKLRTKRLGFLMFYSSFRDPRFSLKCKIAILTVISFRNKYVIIKFENLKP